MTPHITKWADFAYVSEEFDSETHEFQYTMFAIINSDDVIYYGELPTRKAEISFQQFTLAPLELPADVEVFIKRPDISRYDVYKRYNVVHLLVQSFLEEARTMEFLSAHPHPYFIRYHGCRFRKGYLTGIVLSRHSHDLKSYLSRKVGNIDKKAFMNALESAIHHLHSLGWAHNDLNPTNVLVDDSEASRGMPVLIDFGSAREVGSLLGTSRGTSGWIQGRIEDYTTSKKEHDVFARRKCGSGWTTRLSTMIKAEEFELDIYTLQLSGISDSQLIKLLAELPPKCIVLAEEVEAANYNGEPT